jgi:signal transduction histidine kinase
VSGQPPLDELLGPLLERAGVGIALLDESARYLYVNERLAEINRLPAADHIGRTLAEAIPHISEVVERLHGEVLRTGKPVLNVQIAGSTPGTPENTWQVSYLPLDLGGARAVGVVLVDVSERVRAVAEARRRTRQHAAVADLGQRSLAGGPTHELLDAACKALTRELGADLAGVLEFATTRDHLVMCAGTGWPDGAVGAVTAQVGRGSQAGFTLMLGAPVLTSDLETESRFTVSESIIAQGARSTISTPIPGAAAPFGVLGVFSRRRAHFDEDDAGFVRAVANVLGAAVMNEDHARALEKLSAQRGRLVAQGLEAGEREQRQVATVLHDDVLQHLLFARQELADAELDPTAVERARVSVGEAAALLRRVVAGLHPVTLAHAGLTAALENLATDQAARAGIDISVAVDPAAERTHDRLIVTIVRELLTNVAKHARATRAAVTVSAADGHVGVLVADDGVGLSPEVLDPALSLGNIGLATTRERVEALGGSARITSGLGKRGAAVEIRLPH